MALQGKLRCTPRHPHLHCQVASLGTKWAWARLQKCMPLWLPDPAPGPLPPTQTTPAATPNPCRPLAVISRQHWIMMSRMTQTVTLLLGGIGVGNTHPAAILKIKAGIDAVAIQVAWRVVTASIQHNCCLARIWWCAQLSSRTSGSMRCIPLAEAAVLP